MVRVYISTVKGHKMELRALGTQSCVFLSLFVVCFCVVDIHVDFKSFPT